MNTNTYQIEKHNKLSRKKLLKLGGVFAVVGGLGYFITLLFHGDLPDQTTEIALQHIANRPEWRLLKLSLIISLLLWVASFEIFHNSTKEATSRLFSRLAVIAGTIGITIVIVEYAMIGFALKDTADKWISSTGKESEILLGLWSTILSISGGLFHSFVAWMIGLPFILMGLAVTKNNHYHSWFGWIAVILGSGVLMAGITRFLGIDLIPYPILYGGFIIPLTLWLVGLGCFMWLKSRTGTQEIETGN